MRRSVFAFTLAALVAVPAVAAAAPTAPEPAPDKASVYAPSAPLVVAGLGGAGAAYGLTAWMGARDCHYLDSFCEAHQKELLIPLVGPVVHATSLAASPLGRASDLVVDPIHLLFGNRGWRYFTVSALVVDSAVQIGGVALATYGLFRRETPKRALRRGLTVRPVLSLGQVGVSGDF